MTEKPLWVIGCPYCNIFTQREYKGKLIFPETEEELEFVEVAILEQNKTVIIVYRDHISSITKEAWGRLLYHVRKCFGNRIRLKVNIREIDEHFYCMLKKDKY